MVGTEQVAVIGCEDNDGILFEPCLAQRFAELTETVIEGRTMGVVTSGALLSSVLNFRRHIWPQRNILGSIPRPVIGWGRLIRVVRRSPGKHQKKRFV